MSRNFWMPDESCRVCYECDSQFTIFNRKHHCRLCGRVFCAKCTTNSVPAQLKSGREDGDRIRVCSYCFKQRKDAGTSMMFESSPGLSPSLSSSSLVSTQSTSSSTGSAGCPTGPFQHVSQFPQMDPKQDHTTTYDYLNDGDNKDHFGSYNRSDDEDDDYPICGTSYVNVNYNHTDHVYESQEAHPNEEIAHPTCNSTMLPENVETQRLVYATRSGGETDPQNDHIRSDSPPLDELCNADIEAVDYENNGLMWLPPEPEDEEDEREAITSDDDDDAREDDTGDWGYSRSSSFLVGECRSRDRSNEEQRKAMKRVADGHFRGLISQILQAEKLPATEHESWLDIITTLSWEAATFLKPDTSRGGGMDPGGYVKVKCIACGHRNESMVVKGVVCKKNVAHRRMTSKIEKARLLLLDGALEYQRVANHLSSFDTLLQQEMDHLKMAVAKIDAHHPNILLVEKSVSRYAQEYLLAKNISLVLNIKRPLLERIARCTGAQIVPSIDHLSSPILGYCDSIHVDKFVEDLGTVGQGGMKSTKTLMFFEGCPRPLGCTILLKGASRDELKKVKHVVNYGVFAAYHLALETSFLADEGASLPDLPLKSPIKAALPDEPSTSIHRSISMIPGFASETAQVQESQPGQSPETVPVSEVQSFSIAQTPNAEFSTRNMNVAASSIDLSDPQLEKHSVHNSQENLLGLGGPKGYSDGNDNSDSNNIFKSDTTGLDVGNNLPSHLEGSGLVSLREDFPPSTSDNQSILVSRSTRCVWKGSVCEHAHLFRIKYYGSSDKPLGRFLRDDLFDQGYQCRSCEMPSEAHVHCYTHRQGSLTISVKMLQEAVLPGEREGKIWMWHRCLRCPRTNGFPPATKRVVMSDAAWGLSLGKFLELSFSNHAAATRVASCGHSLHRDCLRFYGFGKMVACFRYAPIIVHSVYLPPSKLEFNYRNEEWIQHEFNEVDSRADLLFNEVLEALHHISDTTKNEIVNKAPGRSQQIVELELMLKKEKKEFKESLWSLLKKEAKTGEPEVDILEINRLKRQLVFHSYVWDQRLIHVSKPNSKASSSSIPREKRVNSKDKRAEMDMVSRSDRGFSSWDSSLVNMNSSSLDSFLVNMNSDTVSSDVEHCKLNFYNRIHEGEGISRTLSNIQDTEHYHSSSNQSYIPQLEKTVRRARSEGQFPEMDNLDAERTGNPPPEESTGMITTTVEQVVGNSRNDRIVAEDTFPLSSGLPAKEPTDMENPSNWHKIPFLALYRSLVKNSTFAHKLGKMVDNYSPVYISSFRELVNQSGLHLLFPIAASSDTIVPIYDNEPTSIISYAMMSPDYRNFMSEEFDKQKESLQSSSSFSILDSVNLLALHSFDESPSESLRSLAADESILSSVSRSFSGLDPLLYPNPLHARVSFSDDSATVKVKFTVTCYFAKQFDALRRTCCANELDFIRSLSRCKKWGAQGGKSNVFFAKTLDDRFIIKQLPKTELESFIKFAPAYFEYVSASISSGYPTCLAKILGIYQVTSRHLKGGKESKMDVLVMENLLFGRNITRLYDLKGSTRSRYNPDSSGSNKVLLDQNLIEAMPTSPIFLGTKAKHLLDRAVWNDTSFLASIDVMDYSLLVGVDEKKHELVLGIIDFMRQYTWDKHLETWVKASGILGGSKNAPPTVISPKQYKKRFRKAMSAYFLMVPDQWPIISSFTKKSQSDLMGEDLSNSKQ